MTACPTRSAGDGNFQLTGPDCCGVRQTPSGARPPLVLLGFALLLLLIFAGAFAAGRAVGPSSPRPAPGSTDHSGDDMPGMTMGMAR
ncbi:hypothetical protein ACIGXM_10910 [Kitasatospora sp. NPDC052896]|uniref:hypothetical protein n=1 Tax=Kitasatospora sp. NPDC052896 TaxID=3364061 RepID=UPI0037C53163